MSKRYVTPSRLPPEYDHVAIAKVIRRLEDAIGSGSARAASGSDIRVVQGGAAPPAPPVDVVQQILSGAGSSVVRVYDLAAYRHGESADNEPFLKFLCPRTFIATGFRFGYVDKADSDNASVTVCGVTFEVEFQTGAIIAVPYPLNPVVVYQPGDYVQAIVNTSNGLSGAAVCIYGYWVG